MNLDEIPLSALLSSEATAAAAVANAMGPMVDHQVRVQPLGDGALVALGRGRYVNRAVGVGPSLSQTDLDAIVRFYTRAELPAALQLTSIADQGTIDLLTEAEFRPQLFRAVHAATLAPQPDRPDQHDVDRGFRIVQVDPTNVNQWLDVLALGNEISTSDARAISDEFGRAAHAAVGSTDFLAFDGDMAVGCGSVQAVDGVAWLGGAATIPANRGRGAQLALIRHRLRYASTLGCQLAGATALPGGPSARNLTRPGWDSSIPSSCARVEVAECRRTAVLSGSCRLGDSV